MPENIFPLNPSASFQAFLLNRILLLLALAIGRLLTQDRNVGKIRVHNLPIHRVAIVDRKESNAIR